jgi:hypothetical protein
MNINPHRVKDPTATGIGESPAVAKMLNFDSQIPESQNSPPQRGVVNEAKSRLA